MISLSTAGLYPYGLNRIFDLSVRSGFKNIELMLRSKTDNAFADSWDIEYIKKLTQEFDLNIISIHVPFEFEEKPENFNEIYELALGLDAKYIVAHIPRFDQEQYIKWFKSAVVKKYYNPELLFENVPHKTDKADQIIPYSKLNKIKNLCFDIAHSLRSNIDTKNLLRNLENIRQFHLSDWNGVDDHMDLTKSKNNIYELIKFKNADFCIELCPKIFDDIYDQQEIINKLRDNRKYIEKISKN